MIGQLIAVGTDHCKGPANMFTGDAWFDVLARGEDPSRLRVHRPVRCRCAHRLACPATGQNLHVTEGFGLVHSRGGEVVRMTVLI